MSKSKQYITFLMALLSVNYGKKATYKDVKDTIGKYLVDRNTFKIMHQNDKNESKSVNKRDYIISHIKDVKYLNDNSGVIVEFDDSKIWKYRYIVVKYNCTWHRFINHLRIDDKTVFRTIDSRGNTKGPIKMHIAKCDFSFEAFMAMVSDWYNNELLNSYNGLAVNMRDGCGNRESAEDINLLPDYSDLDNLEYCTKKDILKHGKRIIPLFNLLGEVYNISANDPVFDKLYSIYYNNAKGGDINAKTIIQDYCKKHYIIVIR